VEEDAIRLRLFLFSLLGKAKLWFYANCADINTWAKCSSVFLLKFFPLGRTNALWGRISSFQQVSKETILEAWDRLQEYILACPHHGMDNWIILQSFYNGLTPTARGHIDATTGGDFFSLTIAEATKLIEKMVFNQGWSDDRLQPRQRGTHIVKEADMLHAKMDQLMKRMDALTSEKAVMAITTEAMDARMTCEVFGDTGLSGNYCPATQEDVMYMNNNNNGYHSQGGQTWNQSRSYY
jgi:hypothetical protein